MDSSAPPKPWERGGRAVFNQEPSLPGTVGGDVGSGGPVLTGVPESSSAPALPPRPSEQRTGAYGSSLGTYGSGMGSYGSYGGYGSYGSSMYGSSPFGGYSSGLYGNGMYGSGMYGGYGGYNRYGMNELMPNSFAQRAEADARQAFQSIESVVHVFGSISMMLESTFNAVYSSFRAVIGVADHFSRLKLHLTQIFSAIAVIKTLKWLFRKLMVILRLRSAADFDEKWEGAATAALSKEFGELGGRPSRWPVFIFFAMVFGGPWLIWKLLSTFIKEKMNEDWATGNGDHYVAIAQHDFAADREEEVSFKRGQQIRIAPKDLQPRVRGWLLGSADGVHKGLLPANYVTVKGKQRGRKTALNSAIAPASKNTDSAVVSPEAVWDSTAPIPAQPKLDTNLAESFFEPADSSESSDKLL